MRTETTTRYFCEKCGQGYLSERLALHCESGGLPVPPVTLSRGEEIWIAVDHQMDAVEFGCWVYRASLGFSLNSEISEANDSSHIDYLLKCDPTHQILIGLNEPHYYEDEITVAWPDTTALVKHAKTSITGREIHCSDSEWYS